MICKGKVHGNFDFGCERAMRVMNGKINYEIKSVKLNQRMRRISIEIL